jgi:hypothetical protein
MLHILCIPKVGHPQACCEDRAAAAWCAGRHRPRQQYLTDALSELTYYVFWLLQQQHALILCVFGMLFDFRLMFACMFVPCSYGLADDGHQGGRSPAGVRRCTVACIAVGGIDQNDGCSCVQYSIRSVCRSGGTDGGLQ